MMPGTYAMCWVCHAVCVLWHHRERVGRPSTLPVLANCISICVPLCVCVCAGLIVCICDCVRPFTVSGVYIKSNIASHFNNVNGVVNKINGTRRQANFSHIHISKRADESVHFSMPAPETVCVLACVTQRATVSATASSIDYRLLQMMHKSHLIWPVQRITSVPPPSPACRSTTNYRNRKVHFRWDDRWVSYDGWPMQWIAVYRGHLDRLTRQIHLSDFIDFICAFPNLFGSLSIRLQFFFWFGGRSISHSFPLIKYPNCVIIYFNMIIMSWQNGLRNSSYVQFDMLPHYSEHRMVHKYSRFVRFSNSGDVYWIFVFGGRVLGC